ncbi:uncharacterized protein LOC126795602 [Argentina anserina]|uniref:uncharacterized protein LOC126795602 n=1 Tax=Argentina anserina TaxID=57926 RepID=UPI0021767C8C|nr:uncharacterized protein LOC126795602 [Potentilla anserina]
MQLFSVHELAFVEHEARVGSDHSPIVLHSHAKVQKNPKTFRYEANWATDPDCQELVANAWNPFVDVDPFVGWENNLACCRKKLVCWSRAKFPNNKAIIDALCWELKGLHEGPIDGVNKVREDEICDELEAAWAREELFWKQRSRVSWLLEGDRNTKFFYVTTVYRRNKNRISSLCLDNGNWISGEAQISAAFADFFDNLYCTSGSRRLEDTLMAVDSHISESENLSLAMPFSPDEIRKALGNWKAPGPDGYPGHFYKEHWEVVSGSINSAVACFRNSDSSVIISKLLANRLKPLLPSLISKQQNAFVPGRLIQDNLILAHEAYHYLKLKRSKKGHEFALKLDMQKAYDRVEWDFLEAALLKFGFSLAWVRLIMKATASNCRALKSILDSYCVASGQAVNLGKSSVFFSVNSPPEIREMVTAELEIPISSQPGIYLGLPTIWGNSKKSAMAYIRERINQKIQGWKANILSQAGREVLIKAVAMAVPAYPMAIFLLLKALCKNINSDLS